MKALLKLILDKISFFFSLPNFDDVFDSKGNLIEEAIEKSKPVKKKSSKKKVGKKKKASKKKVSSNKKKKASK